MALVKCKECGEEISSSAKECPKCGAKQKSGCLSKVVVGIAVFFLVLIIINLFSLPDKTNITSTEKNDAISTLNVKYTKKRINIRNGPGKQYKIVGSLNDGQKVETGEFKKGWYEISINGARQGYVYASLLKDDPPPTFQVVSWNWHYDSGMGVILWVADIKNNGDKEVEFLTVTVTTYSRNDDIIDTGAQYILNLPAGRTRSVKGFVNYFGTEKKAKIQVEKSF